MTAPKNVNAKNESVEDLKSKLKSKIDSLGKDTLERLYGIIEASKEPKDESPLTDVELNDKALRKKEEKIYTVLLKFVKKEYEKSKKEKVFPGLYKEDFSPEDPKIQEILAESAIVSRVGLKKRLEMIKALPESLFSEFFTSSLKNEVTRNDENFKSPLRFDSVDNDYL